MSSWIDKVLFQLKSSGGFVSRRNLEPVLMSGAANYDQSLERFRELLDRGYILRVEDDQHSFELSQLGNMRIASYYESVITLMSVLERQLESILYNKKDIEIKGGITGLFFTYTKMSMFRFHPYKGVGNEAYLLVRLPNLIGGDIGHESNELYLSLQTLEGTDFLKDIVIAHLTMVDKYFEQGA